MPKLVPIELDGKRNAEGEFIFKKRNLKGGFRSTVAMQKAFKELDIDLTEGDDEDFDLEHVPVYLYSLLVHEDKKLTVDKCYDLIDECLENGHDMEYLMSKMNEAMASNKGSEALPTEE